VQKWYVTRARQTRHVHDGAPCQGSWIVNHLQAAHGDKHHSTCRSATETRGASAIDGGRHSGDFLTDMRGTGSERHSKSREKLEIEVAMTCWGFRIEPEEGTTRTAIHEMIGVGLARDGWIVLELGMHGSIGKSQACSSVNWYREDIEGEVRVVAQEAAAQQSVPGTLWDWTWARQPSGMLHTTARATRAHRTIHSGAIATLIKAIIGASNWPVGNKTRPSSSSSLSLLAAARIAAILIISLTLVTQPPLYSNTRVASSRHDTSQEPDGLGLPLHTYLARPLPGQWS
jgi:hypothetical protein